MNVLVTSRKFLTVKDVLKSFFLFSRVFFLSPIRLHATSCSFFKWKRGSMLANVEFKKLPTTHGQIVIHTLLFCFLWVLEVHTYNSSGILSRKDNADKECCIENPRYQDTKVNWTIIHQCLHHNCHEAALSTFIMLPLKKDLISHSFCTERYTELL